tara:strand:- start:4443 stop:4640 length:198 start_codon:yes stop_codon:yes gene_type:complete
MSDLNGLPFEEEEWFPELDALQESGAINMFGAPRWLQDNFGMNRVQALGIFNAWVKYVEKKYENV